MTNFEFTPDPDAVFFEFKARSLQPRLQAMRECLLAIKDEAFDLTKQQWARSKKDHILTDFTVMEEDLRKIDDSLARVLFAIRELKTLGRVDACPGISELDL